MARYTTAHKAPGNVIRVYQQTIQDLINNTLLIDYYNFIIKAMNEGYQVLLVSINDEEIPIEDLNHAKNMVNHLVGFPDKMIK